MDLTKSFREFCSEPLAILPDALDGLLLQAQIMDPATRRERKHAAFLSRVQASYSAAARRSDGVIIAGRTAIVPVFGVIDKRAGFWTDVSTDALGATVENLAVDRQVRSILMVYDTPGGSVAGVQELGEKMRDARDAKKIMGIADPMAASAGLWLISQSSEVAVTPSGQIGSLGVISMHVDASKMLEKEGIAVTLVTSSRFKAEGNPFGPLGEEALGERQGKVNHYHGAFVEAVAKGRGTTEHKVGKNFGEGRMLTPEQAKAVGMVDRVATLEHVLHLLGVEGGGVDRAVAVAKARARAAAVAAELSFSS